MRNDSNVLRTTTTIQRTLLYKTKFGKVTVLGYDSKELDFNYAGGRDAQPDRDVWL